MSATNRGTIRVAQDAYYTPQYTINLILEKIDLSKVSSSLEPCRGDGRIYNLLPDVKHWCEMGEGRDYLKIDYSEIDLIVTNPPFSLAIDFLRKSLLEAKTVVYLMRLEILGSRKRNRFWSENPPSHLYVLSERPSFSINGKTDMTEYAWFVWDRGDFIVDPPGIYVLGERKREVNLSAFDEEWEG